MKRTFYLFSNGELKRKDNTIYFETENGEKRFLPVEDISEIMAFGEVSLNKRLLEFLSQSEIIVHYFNYYGYYMGTFYPREHMNSGYMTLRQAEHYLDDSKRLDLAKRFVKGAADNMLRVVKYYEKREKDISNVREEIERRRADISDCDNGETLMAIEGNVRNTYYEAFDAIVGQPAFAFESRTRRPPRNYMNTLISFGNSMMYSVVLSQIYRTHLDPRIGYLHATNFRRFTLNLDVAEIFKPIIVDRIIFTLLGRRQLSENDFVKGTEGVVMKENARKMFVEEFDQKLQTTQNYKSLNRQVSYRHLIRLELYKLEKHLMGEKQYDPYVAAW
ncbi:MAG: type I-B CRISPR-associated endonuclease Cas1b [Clostridia bacterium]|nr:type I-B CRISPR-associated endonuclease Cas1b [Clostridia bacterium]